jgi:membrane protein
MFISSAALRLYAANFGHYDQIYGQLGAVIVTMLWLYYTGLVLLIGAEMNAVLARIVRNGKASPSYGREVLATKPRDRDRIYSL